LEGGGGVELGDLFLCRRYNELFGMTINHKSVYRLPVESYFTVMKITNTGKALNFEVMFKEFKAV
jgi:hypothetical protein